MPTRLFQLPAWTWRASNTAGPLGFLRREDEVDAASLASLDFNRLYDHCVALVVVDRHLERSGWNPRKVADEFFDSYWGTDEGVSAEVSPIHYVRTEVPQIYTTYGSSDRPEDRKQRQDFADALRQVGHTKLVVNELARRSSQEFLELLTGFTDENTALLNFVASNLQSD